MVKYEWDESNGVSVPTNKLMTIDSDEYYVGMPLKKVDAETVAPTDGDPEYICLAQRNAGDEIRPLQIPVQEVFPDAVYTKILEDGTEEKVKFGGGGGGDILDSNGKLKSEVLPDGYPYEGVGNVTYDNSAYQEGDEVFGGMLFKVSNDTPAYDELLGGKIGFPDGEMIVDESILRGNEDLMMVGEACIVTYRDNVEVFNGTILPTKGMYMVILSLAPISLTCSKNVVKPIDPKFIPKITIVKDGYDNAAMGVAPALTVAETATANATFNDVMQGLVTRTLPPIELYTYHDGMLEHIYGGRVNMVMDESGELRLDIAFFYADVMDSVAGYKIVSWRSDNSIEVSNMSIR